MMVGAKGRHGRAGPVGDGPQAGPSSRALEWFGAALVFCLGLAIYYREPIFSGFREITGDRGDGRYYVFILEHWYKVFAGAAVWTDPPMFFPTTGVLGYSDAEFAQAIPYAAFRLVGADPFLAFQLMDFTQNLIGFAGLFALARHVARAPWWLAAGAAFAFAFANGMYVQIGHPQNLSVMYYPVIVLLLVGAVRRMQNRLPQAILLAFGGGLSLAALLFTGYYMGFFFILLGGVALVLYVLFDWRRVGRYVAEGGRRLAVVVCATGTGLGIGLIPFFLVYLPVVRGGAKRDFAEVMHYAPTWQDLLNYGWDNLLWSWVSRNLTELSHARLHYGEVSIAPTPLLVVGAIGLWFWLLCRNRQASKPQLRLCAALFLAGAVLLMSTVRVDGTSAWWLIWKLVPGADGLRVPYRIAIPVQAALVMVVLLCGAALLNTAVPTNRTWRHSILFALVILICVGQVNLGGQGRLNRRAERNWIAAVPVPPPACRSFAAIDSRLKPNVHIVRSVFLQVDALMVAKKTGLPTINGYSGLLPRHWELIQPDQVKAKLAARAWVLRHRLQDGFCVFDLGKNRWSVGLSALM